MPVSSFHSCHAPSSLIDTAHNNHGPPCRKGRSNQFCIPALRAVLYSSSRYLALQAGISIDLSPKKLQNFRQYPPVHGSLLCLGQSSTYSTNIDKQFQTVYYRKSLCGPAAPSNRVQDTYILDRWNMHQSE